MINKRGLSTEPWWTPTLTPNSLLLVLFTLTLLPVLLYVACTNCTIHSSTPSFRMAPDNFFSYSIECPLKVNKCDVQFPVISQMFFWQLSEDECCINSVQTRHEVKFHALMNALSQMIFSITLSIPFKAWSRSLRPLYLPLIRLSPFPFPVRWDGIISYVIASSATNRTPVSPEALNISATIPKRTAALPFFILVIAFATISIVMSTGGPATVSAVKSSEL